MDKTGGAAFGHGAENGHCCGMTVRQYYIAHASPMPSWFVPKNLPHRLTVGDLGGDYEDWCVKDKEWEANYAKEALFQWECFYADERIKRDAAFDQGAPDAGK